MELLEQEKSQAKKAMQTADLPLFKYGSGIGVTLPFDLEQLFAESKELEPQKDDPINVKIPQKVELISLNTISPELFRQYFQTLAPATENKILAHHYAIIQDAIIIRIPKNTSIAQPIHITTNSANDTETIHIIIIAEEGSTATIVETLNFKPSTKFISQVVQVYAKTRANLTYCTLQNLATQSVIFTTKRGKAFQDAHIRWYDAILGSSFNQVNLKTYLAQQGAQVTQNGIVLGTSQQQTDLNIEAIHQKPHTKSTLLMKNVLTEKSKVLYRGTIKIEKNAFLSQGVQRADTLLLGSEAHCDAVPILDVENNEVICSHGTTISTFDEEELFYLLSRGLNESQAKELILRGFLETITSNMPEEIKLKIDKTIEESICP